MYMYVCIYIYMCVGYSAAVVDPVHAAPCHGHIYAYISKYINKFICLYVYIYNNKKYSW